MPIQLHDGDPFIYMKVGLHAQESLSDIIKRKRKEIEDAGVTFWGYGGSTCHPLTAVQPFVKHAAAQGSTVHLLMQSMNSKHDAPPARADSFSADGFKWEKVPRSINVLGSRYALVLDTLEEIDLPVALEDTTVGVGRLMGAPGSSYIRGRVDKACLRYSPGAAGTPSPTLVGLGLAARLAAPYAVLLK